MRLILAAALLISGPQVLPRTAARQTPPGINFFSPQQDIDIGNDSAEQAERQLNIVRDARLNQYIRSIAQRVLGPSLTNSNRYQFYIVNSNEVSSLALPNGSIFIYRGLLAMTSNDDEVAALIAHELGHVMSRHATSQLSRQLLVQAPISLSGGLPSGDGWKEQLNKLGVVFGVNAPFLHYSPEQEIEASQLATKLLTTSHFAPAAFDALLQKLIDAGKKPDAPMLTFLFSHPVPINGEKDEADPEGSKPSTRHSRPSAEFKTFQNALLRLPKPAVEKAAEPTTDPMPNVFSHPLNYYRINYPDGWQVVPTGPNGAILSAPGGLTTTSAGDDVAYGIMVDMFDLSPSEKPLTLEQATNRLIVYLRQRNQTVRAVPGAQTPVFINDEVGLRTVLLRGGLIRNGNSTITERSEVLWLVTKMYYQNLFYMVFVAPEEEFPSRQPVFEQIIRSVQIR